jgi:hypothetical protein
VPRSEDIRNTIWSDLDEVLESNDAMLLYIWSWTNERCGAAGIYTCPRRLLLEGRLTKELLAAALDECEAAGKIRYVDGVVWSVTRVKRLGWKTPNAAKAIAKELGELDPANPIHTEFLDRYDGHPWGKDGEGRLRLMDGSANGPGTDGQGSDNPSGTHEKDGVEPKTPPGGNPSPWVTGKGNGDGKGEGTGSGEVVAVGSQATVDLPETVGPQLGEVEQILGRISESRGLPFAERHRVAAAIATYPDADAVAIARDFEDWLCSGKGRAQSVPDLIQAFRSQLDRKRPKRAGGTEHPADRRVRELREAEVAA